MSKGYKGTRCIVIDESGNFGKDGRYFVIACIDTENYKTIYNMMKKEILNIRKRYPNLAKLHSNEIKACNSNMSIKEEVLTKLINKDFLISYIVIDLKHIENKLISHSNLLYNYALKLLIDKLDITDKNTSVLNLICDNKSVKTGSVNTLDEYLKIHLLYEKKLNIDFNIQYKDSNANDAYVIMAIDFIANAIYAYYECKKEKLYGIISKKVLKIVKFPKNKFGKD